MRTYYLIFMISIFRFRCLFETSIHNFTASIEEVRAAIKIKNHNFYLASHRLPCRLEHARLLAWTWFVCTFLDEQFSVIRTRPLRARFWIVLVFIMLTWTEWKRVILIYCIKSIFGVYNMRTVSSFSQTSEIVSNLALKYKFGQNLALRQRAKIAQTLLKFWKIAQNLVDGPQGRGALRLWGHVKI